MNGPTMRRLVQGNTRPTSKPPRSRRLESMISSMDIGFVGLWFFRIEIPFFNGMTRRFAVSYRDPDFRRDDTGVRSLDHAVQPPHFAIRTPACACSLRHPDENRVLGAVWISGRSCFSTG